MKILTVVGARPQFIKAAAISRRLREGGYARLSETIVHTGQHYDYNMSADLFTELEIPEPAINLCIGSGSHAEQTGRISIALEEAIARLKPDLMLVYGDTNSTLAGALVAAKAGLPLAHVEAGLRSHRPGMPEEVNRVVTDRLADFLFCPTGAAIQNLADEGRAHKAHMVGDVMFDVFRRERARVDVHHVLADMGLEAGQYVLATVHRAENTDDHTRLLTILGSLAIIAKSCPVLLPLHPRTRAAIARIGAATDGVRIVEPLPYRRMLAVLLGAAAIATDSGGVQKEAYFASVPCVTLRDETEWVETIGAGWNRLAPPGLGPSRIAAVITEALGFRPASGPPSVYGSGDAAGHILDILARNA